MASVPKSEHDALLREVERLRNTTKFLRSERPIARKLSELQTENEALRHQIDCENTRFCDAQVEISELHQQLAECKKDAERYRFDSYAGVIMWIGDKRTMKIATREQVASEVEYGCVITHTAQHCLDELSAMGETKC